MRRSLLEDGYELLQSADELEGVDEGAAFVRELLFEVLFAEFVDIAADVTNVRGLLASALRAPARFPSLQFVKDVRLASLSRLKPRPRPHLASCFVEPSLRMDIAGGFHRLR